MHFSFEQAKDRMFWEGLCPAMAIDEPIDTIEQICPPEQWKRRLEQLRADGYLRLGEVCPEDEASKLADAVSQVTKCSGFPIFALVYDAFWRQLVKVAPLFREILGGEVRILPDSWVWRLTPTEQDAGWAPHRDRDHGTIDKDGTPHVISFWLALTDATPLNGCIYVLPASLDADYARTNRKGQTTSISFQDIRALPSPAGHAMCWNHQLLHWGGRSSQYAEAPRISVAFEIQRSSVPAFSKPLMTLDALPHFEMRLGLIGRQLLQYQHMAKLTPEMIQLASDLHSFLPKERIFSSVLGSLFGKKRTLPRGRDD